MKRLCPPLAAAILAAHVFSASAGSETHDGSDYAAPADEGHSAGSAVSANWGYGEENGPEHWASLDPSFELCGTGGRQSPINLTQPFQAAFSRLQFEWRATSWTVENNGHAIQVHGPLAGDLIIEEEPYALQQLHLHSPSEHTINGQSFPAEIHFVHKSAEGNLAVLAVMVSPGERNNVFRSIMRIAPKDLGTAELGLGQVTGLVPMRSRFYRYYGSLTTPPCTEGVLWTIMEDPLLVSEDDLEAFTDLYSQNARSVQPLNRRFLLAN